MSSPLQQQPGARFTRSPRVPSLPPRHQTYRRDSFCFGASAVGAFAGAPIVGLDSWAGPAAAVATFASIATAIFGRRKELRDSLLDEVIEDLCPILGLPEATRAALTVKRWLRGWEWPRLPEKLVVHYDSAQAVNDSTWIDDIAAVFEAHGWGFFELDRHDHARRRLTFYAAEPPAPAASDSEHVIRAKRIVAQLLGPSATVSAIDVSADTGDVTSMEVRHELGAKLESDGYRTRIERGVGATLPGRWRAKWNLHTDWVRFEQRTAFPDSVWLPVVDVDVEENLLATYDKVEIPYGIDEDGNEVFWRPAIDPNLMLIGTPGTGKTVTAHNLLVSFARHGWPIWVLDGKYVEFLGYQDWPNVQVVATTIEQQVAMVHRAHELMEFRYQSIVSGEATEADFEPVLVFLDEWAEFRGNVEAWYTQIKSKGDPRQPPVLGLLASMARKARTSRVHLVFGTQRPDALYFVGDMRDNFSMRISMGRLSPQGALMMWQSPAIGTSVPRGCRGRGTTVSDNHKPIEIQCYRVPDPRKVVAGSFEAELLDALRPTATRHPRLLIVPPEAKTDIDADDDKVKAAPLTYYDFVDAEWVLADSRPDLDPVLRRRKMNRTTGARISSPTALLGLLQQEASSSNVNDEPGDVGTRVAPTVERVDTAERSAEASRLLDKLAATSHRAGPSKSSGRRSAAKLTLVSDPEDDAPESDGSNPEDDEYGPIVEIAACEVALGDLLYLEESGDWVVVDTDPEPDIVEDDLLSLTWRSDSDEVGELALPDSSAVSIRRPKPIYLGV